MQNYSIITSIPIQIGNQLEPLMLDVYTYDTPLQMAYRFCNKFKLEFSTISPLSKSITTYIALLINGTFPIDPQVQKTLQMHFEKFLSNPNILECPIVNSCICINKKPELDFTFHVKPLEIFPTPSFRQVKKIENFNGANKNLLNEFHKQESEEKEIITDRQVQKQRGISYANYKQRSDSRKIINESKNIRNNYSSLQQLQQSLQTLPKSRAERNNSISTQSNKRKIEQQKILDLVKANSIITSEFSINNVSFAKEQNEEEQASQTESNMSSGTVVNLKKQSRASSKKSEKNENLARASSFKDLMEKIAHINKPIEKQRRKNIHKPRYQQIQYFSQQSKQQHELVKLDLKKNGKLQNNNTKQLQESLRQSKTELKIEEIFRILDNDEDGFIDPNLIDLRKLKDHVRQLLQPIWLEILLSKQKICRKQFNKDVMKRQFSKQYQNIRLQKLSQIDLKQFLNTPIKKT